MQVAHRAENISGASLLRDAQRFRQHVEAVGKGRISSGAVQRLALFLLEDQHLAILATEADPIMNGRIAGEILAACDALKPSLLETVTTRLGHLRPVEKHVHELIAHALPLRLQRERQSHWQPVLVVVFTLLLCLLLWAMTRS